MKLLLLLVLATTAPDWKKVDKAYINQQRRVTRTYSRHERGERLKASLSPDGLLRNRSKLIWDWLERAKPGDVLVVDSEMLADVRKDGRIAREPDRDPRVVAPVAEIGGSVARSQPGLASWSYDEGQKFQTFKVEGAKVSERMDLRKRKLTVNKDDILHVEKMK